VHPVGEQEQLRQDALAASIEANGVEFTDEQRASLRDAFFEAELALLRRVAVEAADSDNFETSRKLSSLVAALQGLRSMALQSPTHLWAVTRGDGWFGYAPNTGETFDPDLED
jgi:hypothetical protein